MPTRDRFPPGGCLCVLISVVLLAGLCHTPAAAGENTDQDVRKAVKQCISYLWSQWNPTSCWDVQFVEDEGAHPSTYYGGLTALSAYALLAAGESYQSEDMANTIRWLGKLKLRGTYSLAMRINVWHYLPRDKYRKRLVADVKKLVNSVNVGANAGSYIYAATGRHGEGAFDNSNSQMGVLGAWVGSLNNVEVRRAYWKSVERHWRKTQWRDGGWGYTGAEAPKQRSYGSMSAAGLASMFICFDALHAREFVKCGVKVKYPAIERGLEWFDRNFDATTNPNGGQTWHYYYLYGVERVGLASGYKYFGTRDWYKEGVAAILAAQGPDGRVSSDETYKVSNTAFSLLFLTRGQKPVLFNQLEYSGDWRNRPRGLANLTRWITWKFEKEVNWQIINLDVPVGEWHDAPILFISGENAPKLADEQIDKLRKYVYQGGTIFSVAEGRGRAFTAGMRKHYAKMFPGQKLDRLPRDHPIYNMHFKARGAVPPLFAVSNGIRLLAIHTVRDMPRSWQLNKFASAAADFEQAANIYFYVTDHGSLRNRGTTAWPTAAKFTPRRTIKLARLKHAGRYDPEPLAWERFAILLGNETATQLDVSEPMDIAGLSATEHPIAHLTSAAEVALTDQEKSALKSYCRAGGSLVVDAAGGSPQARASAESLLDELFGSGSRRRLASRSELYNLPNLEVGKVRWRRATRQRMGGLRTPQLAGIDLGGRIAVLYSAEDLTAGLVGYQAYGVNGYAPGMDAATDSAYRVMRNALLYLSAEATQGTQPKPASKPAAASAT